MKIILATPVYPPEIGGPATYTKELADRLKRDHEIVIVVYANASEPIEGTTLFTVSKRQPLPIRLVKYFNTLMRASRGADVIYVQNPGAAGLPAIIVGKLLHIPVILKFVGDEAWEHASQNGRTTKRLEEFLAEPDGGLRISLRMALQGFVLRRCAIVTTPSAYLRDALVRTYGIDNNRAKVNYNAGEETDTAPFEAQPVKHQIVTTARLTKWKGLDGLIRAVAILQKQFPDVRAVILGDGPEEESLKKLTQKLGLADCVFLPGRVSRAETWHYRKNSEVYVLNSTYEGLPHTVLTSFAAHIPTVATDIPGTNEAVYHEQSGLLVQPGNDEALAAAIARIFTDSKLTAKIVAGADRILREKFSWDAHMKTLLEFFESVHSKPLY